MITERTWVAVSPPIPLGWRASFWLKIVRTLLGIVVVAVLSLVVFVCVAGWSVLSRRRHKFLYIVAAAWSRGQPRPLFCAAPNSCLYYCNAQRIYWPTAWYLAKTARPLVSAPIYRWPRALCARTNRPRSYFHFLRGLGREPSDCLSWSASASRASSGLVAVSSSSKTES